MHKASPLYLTVAFTLILHMRIYEGKYHLIKSDLKHYSFAATLFHPNTVDHIVKNKILKLGFQPFLSHPITIKEDVYFDK